MLKPRTLSKITAAIERLAARGVEPSIELVRRQIRRDDPEDRSSSRETIAPVLRQWNDERLARASSRILDAVESLAALRSKPERDEVARLLKDRTGGALSVRFTARRGAPPLSVSSSCSETDPPVVVRSATTTHNRKGRSSS